MPYIRRIQSLVNHTDACSTGNKQAGLVNTMDFARIPRTVLKSKTTTFLLSATSGNKITNCCSGECDSNVCPGCNGPK